jgi:hypothetical protein
VSETPRTPQQVAALLDRLPAQAGALLRVALSKAGQDHLSALYKRFSDRLGGDTLHTHSRRLIDSLGYRVSGDALGDLELRTFSAGVPYARLQEFGGDVAPRNVRNLTIPQPAALTEGGDLRFTARELLQRRPDAFFLHTRSGQTWIVAPKTPRPAAPRAPYVAKPPGPGAKLLRKKPYQARTAADAGGGRKDLVFYFLLVPHAVHVPPRLHFRQTWDELAGKRRQLLEKGLAQAVAAATGGGA